MLAVCRPWHRAAPAAAAPAVAPQRLLSGSPSQPSEDGEIQAQEVEDPQARKRPRLSSPDRIDLSPNQIDLSASPLPPQQQQQQQTPGQAAFEVSPGHHQVMPGPPALHVAVASAVSPVPKLAQASGSCLACCPKLHTADKLRAWAVQYSCTMQLDSGPPSPQAHTSLCRQLQAGPGSRPSPTLLLMARPSAPPSNSHPRQLSTRLQACFLAASWIIADARSPAWHMQSIGCHS